MFRVYKCLWCGETMKYFTDIKGKFSKGKCARAFCPLALGVRTYQWTLVTSSLLQCSFNAY